MNAFDLRSPRGSLQLRAAGTTELIASFACEESDWRGAAIAAVEAVRGLQHRALPEVVTLVEREDGLDVTYRPRHGLAPLTGIEAAAALADIADGVALVASLPSKPERIACGPFDSDLFVGDANGGQLLAPGLWAIAYALDKGTRGARMTMRHFICSPESITGVQAAPSETFYFAYALFELLAGREPFPTGDEFGYMTAVREGTRDRLDVLRPDLPRELSALVDRALSPSPGERPPLAELAAALRALAPLPPSPTMPSTAPKPWWRFW